jgi:hypothetical protein
LISGLKIKNLENNNDDNTIKLDYNKNKILENKNNIELDKKKLEENHEKIIKDITERYYNEVDKLSKLKENYEILNKYTTETKDIIKIQNEKIKNYEEQYNKIKIINEEKNILKENHEKIIKEQQ